MELIQIDFDRVTRVNNPVAGLNDKDIIDVPISYAFERSSQILGLATGILAFILTVNVLKDDK